MPSIFANTLGKWLRFGVGKIGLLRRCQPGLGLWHLHKRAAPTIDRRHRRGDNRNEGNSLLRANPKPQLRVGKIRPFVDDGRNRRLRDKTKSIMPSGWLSRLGDLNKCAGPSVDRWNIDRRIEGDELLLRRRQAE